MLLALAAVGNVFGRGSNFVGIWAQVQIQMIVTKLTVPPVAYHKESRSQAAVNSPARVSTAVGMTCLHPLDNASANDDCTAVRYSNVSPSSLAGWRWLGA